MCLLCFELLYLLFHSMCLVCMCLCVHVLNTSKSLVWVGTLGVLVFESLCIVRKFREAEVLNNRAKVPQFPNPKFWFVVKFQKRLFTHSKRHKVLSWQLQRWLFSILHRIKDTILIVREINTLKFLTKYSYTQEIINIYYDI